MKKGSSSEHPNCKDIRDKLNLHLCRKITKGEAITLNRIIREYGNNFIFNIIDKLDVNTSVLYGPLCEQIHIILQQDNMTSELKINDMFKSRKLPVEDHKPTAKRSKKSIQD